MDNAIAFFLFVFICCGKIAVCQSTLSLSLFRTKIFPLSLWYDILHDVVVYIDGERTNYFTRRIFIMCKQSTNRVTQTNLVLGKLSVLQTQKWFSLFWLLKRQSKATVVISETLRYHIKSWYFYLLQKMFQLNFAETVINRRESIRIFITRKGNTLLPVKGENEFRSKSGRSSCNPFYFKMFTDTCEPKEETRLSVSSSLFCVKCEKYQGMEGFDVSYYASLNHLTQPWQYFQSIC